MEAYIAGIVAITTYKVLSLISGVLLTFMGYKLFMSGIWGDAGHAEGVFGDNKVIIKKAAPGTFFVLMGALVIGFTIFKGLELNTSSGTIGTEHVKPKIID